MTDKFLDISIDIHELQRYLSNLEREQFPFVVAKTLTDVAKGAQAQLKTVTGQKFTLRNPWIIKGIRIEPAKKSDVKRLGYAEAAVKHIDPFMIKQEEGGKREYMSHGTGIIRKAQSVPFASSAAMLRTGSGAIKKKFYPGNLLNEPFGRKGKPRGFKLKTKAGNTIIAIRQNHEIKPLFVIEDMVKIRPVYGFKKTVENYVDKHFKETFDRNMKAALDSSKRA